MTDSDDHCPADATDAQWWWIDRRTFLEATITAGGAPPGQLVVGRGDGEDAVRGNAVPAGSEELRDVVS